VIRRPISKLSLRSVDVRRRLDTFLVCGIAAVLGNRFFLVLTGYPQLGNGTLHISHAIWGGLMMAIAIIFAISYLPPSIRGFVAFLGGAGFGWFIDELGKFITRDVNYFFQPTIALIYITFVVMYLAFRTLQQREFQPEEAVLNAIEALKSASLGHLDDLTRRRAIALLDSTGAHDSLANDVRALLVDAPALPPHRPGWFGRTSAAMRRRYLRFTGKHSFVVIVNSLLLLFAFAGVMFAFGLAFDGEKIRGFSEWAAVVSTLVAGAFTVIGAFRLRTSRLVALRWFERGLLVEILVTQVFVFDQEQLAGLIGLVISIVVWLLVRSGINAERDRESLAMLGMLPDSTAPADASTAPAGQPVP
jgi:hypothetical protein